MKTIHSIEARIPKDVKDTALTEPVAITTNNRVTHVVMSFKQYLKLRNGNE